MKLNNKLTPLIKISFTVWLVCVLAFIGVIVLIKDKIAVQISNVHIFALIFIVALGVASFGIGLIAITYRFNRENIKKKSTVLAGIKVFFLLAILPLFLLWNILQPANFYMKVKILGVRGYWKEFKFKSFALKTGAFFIIFFAIFPLWIGGYVATAWFAGTRTGQMIAPMTVVGGSMYPTFPKGNEANSEKAVSFARTMSYPSGFELMGKKILSYEIKRGDIVVFSNDVVENLINEKGGEFIKRVVALPGDTIEIRDRIFYLNNIPQKEPYIAEPRSTLGSQFFPECQSITIPEGKLFVMGDNRKASQDSRSKLGVIDYGDIRNVIPLEKQYGTLDKNWHDTLHDLDNSSIDNLDVAKFVDLLNEERKEAGIPPLKYQPKLEQSAKLRGDVMLKYDDFSFEANKSGYDLKKAMNDVGYSNLTYGEAPTQGYYEAENLIEHQFEFPDSRKFLLTKDYQEIGVAVVRGNLNGCPTQVIVQHLAGYVPPNYKQSDIDSWKSSLRRLKEIKPGWEDLKKYDIYYKENKKNIDRIIKIISARTENIKRIISRMESNQWLTSEEQGLINSDDSLANEQDKLTDKLND